MVGKEKENTVFPIFLKGREGVGWYLLNNTGPSLNEVGAARQRLSTPH